VGWQEVHSGKRFSFLELMAIWGKVN